MTDATPPSRSRHLLAPELAAGLERFPNVDFSHGVAPFRGGGRLENFGGELPEALTAISCEERFVPGPAGAPDVRLLLYTPPAPAARPCPVLFHVHGGGFVLGDPELSDPLNRAWALELGLTVVSVDYRLAPETRWPGAVEDCYAALTWLVDNAAELGVEPARIAVGGESAGGGHAAALALLARERGGPAIAFLLLDSPMLDDRTGSTHAPHPYTGEFVWTPESNRFGWGALLGVEPGSAEVPAAAVPARAETLKGLPPTFLSVGSLDLFLEEDLEFARRLARDGVPCELHVIPGAYHGFGVAGDSPQLRLTSELRRRALARALGIEGG